MEERRDRSEDVRFLALGAVAAFLYGTTVLALFFAAPLQTSWTRGGPRAFLLSISVAFAGVAGWLFWQFRGSPPIGFGSFLMILALPVGLAGAIALINSRWVAAWPMVYKAMAGSLLVVAVATPAVLAVFNNPEIESYMKKGIADMTATMGAAGGEGFTAAVLRSTLDPETLLNTTRRVIASSFAAVFFVFVLLSHWIGVRLAGSEAGSGERAPRLADFTVPADLIWAFLGLWSVVLATRLPFLKALSGLQILEAISWNAALVVSFCYAVQGLALFRHLSERIAPSGPLRWLGTLLVVLLLFNTATGVWTAGALTVLGATETWIPYRINKGVQE